MNQSFATIGSLIGDGAIRVKSIQKDLGGERVEIIEYSDDLSVFIPNVASPTPILGYTFEEVNGHKNITIVTYEDKVSLLLDRRGYNVKIISTILGANIDVISGPKAKEEGINYQPITRSFKKKTMDDNVDTKKAVSNFISDDD
jgi:N utilization substance protein A